MQRRDDDRLWGSETAKAIENFQISGEPIPIGVIHWLGRIKAAAALVNGALGRLDSELATEIVAAAETVASGRQDAQFPVDVFQTGSGTSSNMNVNEVVSALTDGRAHPNDHVNLGQSSNDVFPTAVHLAVLEAVDVGLLSALEGLAASLDERAVAFRDVVKSGRTHLMDAVPITLGQEFAGYAAQIRAAHDHVVDSLRELGRLPLGGTAVGSGLNTHPEFAARVREHLAAHLTSRAAAVVAAPRDHFAVQGARDALAATSGALTVVAVALTKICNDLRWMASGPRTGLSEISLPALQKGSSIMPGKVNPVIPEAVLQVCAQVIGNDTTVTVAAMQGNFELNVMVPVIARNVIESCTLLTSATNVLARSCVDGVLADVERCRYYAEQTLASATALNPQIGYDATTRLVELATATGRSLREVAREAGMTDEDLDAVLDLRRMAAGSAPTPDDT